MADVNDAQPALAEALDHLEQAFRVLFGERACGLVEDDDAGVGHQRAGDLDQLLGADAELPRDGIGPDIGVFQKL